MSAGEALARQLNPESSCWRHILVTGGVPVAAYLDLVSLRSINIDPTVARTPTPVAARLQLGPHGEGLAGALYRLAKGNYVSDPSFFRRRIPRETQELRYKSILSWCREVNPNIETVEVILDFAEAVLRPSIAFSHNGISEKFPLNRASDGTVKWLALVAVMHVEHTLSSIEEPENFLHPFMQEAFIGLCRQLIDSDMGRSFLVSTHSPTLLDCCAPEEVVIFEIDGGITRASRVANREQLAKKISEGRFGLGYFYKTGGMYGEDRGHR